MYRSQSNFRKAHNLPYNAFDFQEWTVGRDITNYDEVKHYLRWREPSDDNKGLNNAFKREYFNSRDGVAKAIDQSIPDYELSQQSREEMITHDFSQSLWGHSITTFTPQRDNKGDAIGFGHEIEKGHFLILRNKSETTRYIVDEIEYFCDPSDMWSARLSFSTRIN